MPSKDEPSRRWHFVLQANECWTWERLAGDGSIDQVSETCADFGKAVAHALRHGFKPGSHQWTVDHHQWVSCYAPGKVPSLSHTAAREH